MDEIFKFPIKHDLHAKMLGSEHASVSMNFWTKAYE
jgi:hypothetical protein